MLMIPVTFLPATGLVLVAVWIATRLYRKLPAPWMIVFLCSLALQLFLLGARYGYGVDEVLNIQHFTGVLIPPLGFLAFANPKLSARLIIHALPVLAMGLVLFFNPFLSDAVLAAITFFYAAALIISLRRDSDGLFSWAPLRYAQPLRFALLAAVAALFLSGVTDALVAADFMVTGGVRMNAIVAAASLAGLLLLGGCAVLLLWLGAAPRQIAPTDTADDLLEKLTNELVQKELFRDPDMTLSRLSKRLALPAREISQAVNRNTGLNMSQFINNMRIEAVCKTLRETDVSVTTAMLEAGFYTKSNFNREFRRVMGKTPTEWRNSENQG